MTSPLGLFSVIPSMQLSLSVQGAGPQQQSSWLRNQAKVLYQEMLCQARWEDSVPPSHTGGRVQTEQLLAAGKAKTSGDSVQTMTVAGYPNPTQV